MGVLNLDDYEAEEINELLDKAQAFKDGKQVNYEGKKVIANLFFEPSTRTHYSFDMAGLKLGWKTQNFNAGDSSLKKCESLYDTVKTFEMFRVDAVVIRHKENEYNKNYGLNEERVKKMKKESIIMHPEPFNRNVEITDDVVECEKSRIFKQVENGVFVRMALINMVLEE